ncbi:MAG: exodeoxyribonuclease V subunit gamma [Deltaproteobacteria bacterium HGW-Deltaproteobacteria-15]|jgi:exodeoxyribonuclease V gamma subunit|nr:MAG: exodeoxyribonuclease V subunit gamma [Deltaproteobacteria bacterium HGW-Deltaproteobacteria-15]
MKTPRLYTSNRVERLVEVLAKVLETPLSSPLVPEVIVVQSRGMERYLSMQLSERLGIWANCRFPFPNALLEELFKRVLPSAAEGSPFVPDVLTWRIMKALPSFIREPGFESIRLYIEGEDEGLKKLQLSAAIADTFDQYLLFRPEMISRWENGEEKHWQAVLWNQLSRESGRRHRASLARDFIERLQNRPPERGSLPERISVFGISALPRFHMEILAAVSNYTEVNLFLMNPCREYWGDIRSENPGLLSSLGRLGRDFIDLVIELGWEDGSVFDDPGEDTLLHSIQSDMLYLREPEEKGEKRHISPEDRSLQFHACHSPMREVEVLRDQILQMLQTDPDLKPGEILVMTPDIRVYAPYIQAVFDIPSSDPSFIPFSIADRSVREESGVIEPFLSILDLSGSRFGASRVLEILECRCVCRKFGLEEKNLQGIRRWIMETRIRWGIDGKGREEAGAPPFVENTWAAGMERLLLGYAMPGGDEHMFGKILPYDHIEGSDADLLGRFAEFVESLFEWVKKLEGLRRLGEWSDLLAEGIDMFFDPEGDEQREIRLLRQTFVNLGSMEKPEKGGYDGPLDLKTIRWRLGRTLKEEGFGKGFLTGGTTFCAMLPMRSIPFKVLCLIGMDNSAYPRESYSPGFDLIRKEPRPGDRSRRNDDRYLFLEAILSARRTFYVSYVGRSIQDNSAIPPSVLVSELQDHIERGCTIAHGRISDRLLTVHPLQPFSPRYFQNDERLFSYSKESCATALNLAAPRTPPAPFVASGLSSAGEEYRTVDLSDLCSFFSNPSRYILKRRLGLYLEEEVPLPEDKEPLEITGLERYKMEQTMVKWSLEGKDMSNLFPLFKVSGRIPPGPIGECLYENMRKGVENFMQKAGRHIREERLEDLQIDHRIAGFRLAGRVEGISGGGELIRFRYARLRGLDILKAWIIHLALNLAAPETLSRRLRVFGLGEKKRDCVQWCFSPVNESEPLIEELLETYWSGLAKPLHFFPESSWTYALSSVLCGRDPQEAMRRARRTWSGDEWERGEGEDPYYRICFSAGDPLDGDFERLTVRVLGPLLNHCKEMKEQGDS